MSEQKEYLVPDYYPHFACKMGACRTCCCVGWTVSLSMRDYFNLLGVDCEKALRDRLDVAMRPALEPTPEHYAEIQHRYDGNCPLRLPDGRCAVHAELGPGHLPEICRLYPRALRDEGDAECSCACSCERVVELLLAHPEPLRFEKMTVDDAPPHAQGSTVFRERFESEQAVRLSLIDIVQDRARPLPGRLERLGLEMARLERGVAPAFDPAAVPGAGAALAAVESLVGMLDERSESLRAFGETVRGYFGEDVSLFERARERFEARYPDWESGYANLLANHMFFTRFPYSNPGETLQPEHVALCCVYALMRVLAIGYTDTRGTTEALVDVLSALFRLVDHSTFHHYAAVMMQDIGFNTPECLAALTAL